MVPSPLLVRLTVLSIVFAAAGCLWFRLPIGLAGLAGIAAVAAALAGGAWFYRHRRREPRIADSLAGTAMIIVFTASIGTLSYATASFGFPLQDAALARLDVAVGFDWVVMLAWVNERPFLAKLLVGAYYSELFQVPLVVIALALAGKTRALDRFLCVFVLTALATVILSGFFPALGPFPFYNPDPSLHTQFSPGAGRWHVADVEALRAGTFPLIRIEKLEGLVEFPSFHMALAITLIVALWSVPWLRWPGLALNLAVIVGTIPEGGHYLMDLVAGALVAAGCFALYERLATRENDPVAAARPRLQPAE